MMVDPATYFIRTRAIIEYAIAQDIASVFFLSYNHILVLTDQTSP